jgi:hypothetical protein
LVHPETRYPTGEFFRQPCMTTLERFHIIMRAGILLTLHMIQCIRLFYFLYTESEWQERVRMPVALEMCWFVSSDSFHHSNRA